MTRVALFGSTGAIGRNAIQVVEHLGRGYRLSALVANSDAAQLAEQARRLQPDFAAVADRSRERELRERLSGTGVRALAGIEGMNRIAGARQTDVVLMGLSGTAGLRPVLAALKLGKRVAIATKEIIVGYGEIVMAAARRGRAELLPIDSELSAIHQCIAGHKPDEVSRVVLTASGGPFFRSGDLKRVTVAEALSHPTWRMGRKITVDSATLMNKGLEVIETARFFGLTADCISVLIHPQSIVHSLVEFRDGSMLAQLAVPDMRLPIQYALTYPERQPGLLPGVRLETCDDLSFARPDLERFPGLGLAYRALRQGGTKPCVLNVANDVAVQSFLEGRLEFHRIPEVVARTMAAFPNRARPTLAQLTDAERRAREAARQTVIRIAREKTVDRSQQGPTVKTDREDTQEGLSR